MDEEGIFAGSFDDRKHGRSAANPFLSPPEHEMADGPEDDERPITLDECIQDLRNAPSQNYEIIYQAHPEEVQQMAVSADGSSAPAFTSTSSAAAGSDGVRRKKVGLDDFELLKVLGKGSFAKVMLVRKKESGELYAMKVLHKETVIRRNQVEHTLTERNVLQEVQHPFIVSLQYAFQTGSKLYLVLDFLVGGELFFHLKRETFFTEDVARFYAAEIVLALGHLHRLGIIYRDLKPENILLDSEGHVRLTDFGLAKEVRVQSNDAARTFCGTIEYMAPEILMRTGHGKAVDWWSLGTLAYEMLTGAPPFYSKNRSILQQKIIGAKLHFPSYLSENAKSLLAGLLRRDVSKRLGAGPEDAAEIMQHPFFAGTDWNSLLDKRTSPPFRPYVSKNLTDVSNFDHAFTSQTPKDSPVDAFLSASVDQNFVGFSYVKGGAGMSYQQRS